MFGWLRGIHRDAWRDAARMGLEGAVAGAAAYAAAVWLRFVDPFLVIMMAVTSLQRSVGGTIGEATTRPQAAVAGSVLALLCLFLLPEGWGTAAALAASLFVVVGASAVRPAWALGVVPAVGLSLGGEGPLVEAATATVAGVALGAAIGVLVSLVVWPERAEARFERQFRRALRATATRLSDALEATMEMGREPQVKEHVTAWNEAVWLAQESLSAAKFVDRAALQRRLDALRDLHDSVTILDRAAQAESPPAAEEGLRGQVDELRRETCEVLVGLAKGEREDGRIGEIDATLSRLRAAVEEGPAGPGHEAQSAVAFGLSEVRRTLAALIEAEGRG